MSEKASAIGRPIKLIPPNILLCRIKRRADLR